MLQIKSVNNAKSIEVVARLAAEIWNEHYTPIIGKSQVDYMLEKFQSVPAITEQLKQGTQYYLLELEDGPAGYLSFRLERDHLFLSKIYVLESQRGKGLGKAAVNFLEKEALRFGLQKIKLTVNKYNEKSIRAYERMRFKNVDSVVQDIGKGFVMDDFVLEKKVS